MSTSASSPNLVAVVQVKGTGAQYRIEFANPPKNGDCWIIGSAPTADVNIGNRTPGISSKHIGLDFAQDGMVVAKIFSSYHTLLKYESKDDCEKVDNWIHQCYGDDSAQAPAWAVPVNHPVHVFLGLDSYEYRPIEVIVEAFDHTEHLNDYLAAIQSLKSSAPIIAELNSETVTRSQPPQPIPAPSMPGAATSLSRALGGMGMATPVVPDNTVIPFFEETARDIGMYTHSFLEVTSRNNQTSPGSARVVKVLCTRTCHVYAGKYFDQTQGLLLIGEVRTLEHLKDTQAPHVITFIEKFLHPLASPKKRMLVTEWCELGSIVEEGERKPFTYHECCLIVDQTAQALTHLHAQLIVHRDVRPQHILVRSRINSGLEVCLTDFSSSIEIPTRIPTTTDGNNVPATIDVVAATRASLDHYSPRGERRAEDEAYIAPDEFTLSGKIFFQHVKNPAAVDIWSLGVVALELLTGGLPTIVYQTNEDKEHPILVAGQRFTEVLIKHRDELAKSPASSLDTGIIPLVIEMLCPSPADRITAQELAGGTCILVTLLADEEKKEYYRMKYPGGQFPVVMAPRVHAYDLWCGVY